MYTLRHLATTRRAWPLLRLFTMVVAVAMSLALLALVASPAAADGPTKTPIAVTFIFDLADVCPFPVHEVATVSGIEIDYVDKSGALTRSFVNNVEQDTFTANGKTLVSIPYTFNLEFLYDSQGNLTHVFTQGVVVKVLLPDGSLFVSAGRTDLLTRPGGTALTPDRGRSGNLAAFCAALAP